jgi:hypothetical protein
LATFTQYARPSTRRVRTALPGGATIEDLIGRIIAIRTTIASGAQSAGYGDKRVEYRTLSELREILHALEEELADLLGFGGRARQVRMTTQWDKGL